MKFEDIVKRKEKSAYANTGKDAPPEVKDAIERWKLLPEEERKKTPLLYWLLGDSTPAYKMSQEETQYTDNSQVKGQTCGNCEFIYLRMANKKFICSQIRGGIKPSGWCNRWQKARKK